MSPSHTGPGSPTSSLCNGDPAAPPVTKQPGAIRSTLECWKRDGVPFGAAAAAVIVAGALVLTPVVLAVEARERAVTAELVACGVPTADAPETFYAVRDNGSLSRSFVTDAGRVVEMTLTLDRSTDRIVLHDRDGIVLCVASLHPGADQ